MNRVRVKICCISSRQEAQTAIDAGASALGLVGRMPTGPGVIDDARIRDIAASVPPPIATFLLTSETDSRHIIAHHRRVLTTTLQLVDRLKKGTYEEIRQKIPGIRIVQVIHVLDEFSVEEAIQAASSVDALLLDSGNPSRRELGGTGRIHDWTLSRRIVESVNVSVFLAGGLNPQNVRRAIDDVRPFGVDICSGVRTQGHLNRSKLDDFMNAVFRN
jgi:phosphoribosylanthranilate isomerase